MTVDVIIISIFLLIAYDIFTLLKNGVKSTISYVIWTSSHSYPVIPLAVGILMGHLFWSQ